MAKIKDTPHLRLRVDPTLLTRLEKAAEKNGRTLTGEINHRLAESFKKDDFADALEKLSDKFVDKVTYVLQGRAVTPSDIQGRAVTLADFQDPRDEDKS
jgi:hypothetical protein